MELEVASGSAADDVPVQLFVNGLSTSPPAWGRWMYNPVG